LNSSLGLPASTFDQTNTGFYTFPEVFLLPEGSAAASGQVTLLLRDQLDTNIVREVVFDNPGTCATTPLPCPNEIFYTKQSQIDLFPLTYPTCRVIEGAVTLRQSTLPGAAPIENLNGFANLEIIRGNLEIETTSLQNLGGLQNLDSLGGDFNLFKNAVLQDFGGLNSLKYIGGSIRMYDAPALQNLDGLDSLNHLGGSLSLQMLPVLKYLHALAGVKSALQGNIILRNNDALTDLSGIGLLDFSMLQHLELTESAALSGCAQPNICAYLEDGGAATIGANESGCNSVAEVLAACTVSTFSADEASFFRVFPNPLPDGQPLQVLLENDFFGTVKFEILGLDGRVLQVFEKEKTASNVIEGLNLNDIPAVFLVRVSDGKAAATQRVLRL
ncbi:MAG: T9SS type A sorting domain-containing protein, partial [Thermoanaerobaculia bacterium]|nr:T9SS type A sorting domain-containing protein [Thermoanaerobaculia bacterium]